MTSIEKEFIEHLHKYIVQYKKTTNKQDSICKINKINDYYVYWNKNCQLCFEYKSKFTFQHQYGFIEIDRIIGVNYIYYINFSTLPNTNILYCDILFYDLKMENIFAKIIFEITYEMLKTINNIDSLQNFINILSNNVKNKKNIIFTIDFYKNYMISNYEKTITKVNTYPYIIIWNLWIHVLKINFGYFSQILMLNTIS